MTFTDEMDRKRGSKPIFKVELILNSTVYDISKYYISGANFYLKKEREKDKITASDMTYIFNNYDNYFSEYDSSSVFFQKIFLNQGLIKFYVGFRFNGTEEYNLQSTQKIVDVKVNQTNSTCSIRCQDLMLKVIKEKVNSYPSSLVPVANSGNTGNGTMSRVQTKPFSTIDENVTVTFSSSTNFSVVGSVSGSMGSGTVDTEFIASGNQCKFEISAGSVAFVSGDLFTFTLYRFPEWDFENPVKIIWSILTGYDWDSDTQEDWYERSLKFDHTKSSSNVDLDYDAFSQTISEITFFVISGAVPYDQPANELIEDIVSMFLGAVWINPDGKLTISFFKPSISGTLREFSDSKKIVSLEYEKNIKEIVNSGVGRYKATKNWAWSDDMWKEDTDLLDGYYATRNTESINNYGIEQRRVITSYWYSAEGAHVEWSLTRIVDKYAQAPLEVTFKTGFDSLQTELGDRIKVTNEKSKLSEYILEVLEIKLAFSKSDKSSTLTCANDSTTGIAWAFLGSNVLEDDHDWTTSSSQNWDTATSWERQFAYLSTTGATVDPRYYLF